MVHLTTEEETTALVTICDSDPPSQLMISSIQSAVAQQFISKCPPKDDSQFIKNLHSVVINSLALLQQNNCDEDPTGRILITDIEEESPH